MSGRGLAMAGLIVSLSCASVCAAERPLLKSIHYEPLQERTLDLSPGTLREVVVRKTARAPVIDGKLDDPCWAALPAETGFLLTKSSVAGRAYRVLPGMEEQLWAERLGLATNARGEWLARQQTEVKLAYDKDALYLGFTCHEAGMGGLRTFVTERDGKVWKDDAVEVLIDVDRQGKRHRTFILSAGAVQFDAFARDKAWNGQWESSVSLSDKAWYAELRIPFKTLGVREVGPGTHWRVNFARHEQPRSEMSSWSMVFKRFAESRGMGNLFFERRRPVRIATVHRPKPGVGRNRLTVTVANTDSKPITVSVRHVLQGKAERAPGEPVRVTVPAGAQQQAVVHYAVDTPGNYQSVLEILGKNGNDVLDSVSQALGVPARILRLSMRQPEYYVADRTAVAELNLGVSQLSLKDTRITCTLTDAAGGKSRSSTIESPSGQTAMLRLDIGDLPEGPYTVCAELTGPEPLAARAAAGLTKVAGFFD